MRKVVFAKILIIYVLFFCAINPIYVNATEEKVEEYTIEYKKYLELTDEEKEECEVIPRKYTGDVESFINRGVSNIAIYSSKSSNIPEKFDLRDEILIQVENQGIYGLCWAFASLESLETNLALKERKIL